MKIDYEAIAIVIGVGLVFGVVGLIASLSLNALFLRAGFGAFVGFAALPYLNSRKWPARPLVCAMIGGVVAVLLGLVRQETSSIIVVFGLAGVVLGYLAPLWARYV